MIDRTLACVACLIALGTGCGPRSAPPDVVPEEDPEPTARECGGAHDAGCACEAVEPEPCYDGAPGTVGVGPCASGLRQCRAGAWTTCEGQIVDADEVCDDVDNDCDGAVDDGVRSACGDCSDDCAATAYGPEGISFDPDPSNASGVVGTPEGYLTLSGETTVHEVMWIVSSLEGTISRFDTRTREEVARYRTGPLGASRGMWQGDGENPSRTSVNYDGDAYVANRSFSSTSSVTKILYDDCPAGDDGVVTTSSGGTDVLPWTVDGPADDCIAWNTPVGGPGETARAMAVQVRSALDEASHEYAWAGVWSEDTYELDGETGELTGVAVHTPGCKPYGAAIDAAGMLWLACNSSPLIARFDTADPGDVEVLSMGAGNLTPYGMTVDARGDVWVTTHNGSSIGRYQPDTQTWTYVDAGVPTIGGIAVDGDGILWTHNEQGVVVRVDSNTDPLEWSTIETGRGGRGVGIDADGYVWVVNWSDGADDGDVTILDPAAPEDVDTVCCNSISVPYTYSDFSGFQLRNATRPRGTYETILEGCAEGTTTAWAELDLDADVPAGTSVRVEVRTAAGVAELADAAWVLVGVTPPDAAPFDLAAALAAAGVAPEHFLGVRLTLQSLDRMALPVVRGFAVSRSCSNSFG